MLKYFPHCNLIVFVNKILTLAVYVEAIEELKLKVFILHKARLVLIPSAVFCLLSAAHQRSGPTHPVISALRPGPVPLPPHQLRTGNRHRRDGRCKWVSTVGFVSDWLNGMRSHKRILDSRYRADDVRDAPRPPAPDASSVSVPLPPFLQLHSFPLECCSQHGHRWVGSAASTAVLSARVFLLLSPCGGDHHHSRLWSCAHPVTAHSD